MWVSLNGGTPIAGWCPIENPTRMDDFGGYPYFGKPPYVYIYIYICIYNGWWFHPIPKNSQLG